MGSPPSTVCWTLRRLAHLMKWDTYGLRTLDLSAFDRSQLILLLARCPSCSTASGIERRKHRSHLRSLTSRSWYRSTPLHAKHQNPHKGCQSKYWALRNRQSRRHWPMPGPLGGLRTTLIWHHWLARSQFQTGRSFAAPARQKLLSFIL